MGRSLWGKPHDGGFWFVWGLGNLPCEGNVCWYGRKKVLRVDEAFAARKITKTVDSDAKKPVPFDGSTCAARVRSLDMGLVERCNARDSFRVNWTSVFDMGDWKNNASQLVDWWHPWPSRSVNDLLENLGQGVEDVVFMFFSRSQRIDPKLNRGEDIASAYSIFVC